MLQNRRGTPRLLSSFPSPLSQRWNEGDLKFILMAVIILKISPVISVCVQELAPAFHESERLIFYVKSVRHGG